MLFSFNSIYFKLILTYTKIISQYLFLIWFMFLRHSVLIIIWKICSRLSMVILQCWRWGVTSVGSVRCSHHKVQLKTILEPSLLQRQSGAWQTIQNVIETNIDARKYKWIAIIKFSLLARFRCCMWTSLLRKEKLVTFNLQTLKPSSILRQWQTWILSITLDIK